MLTFPPRLSGAAAAGDEQLQRRGALEAGGRVVPEHVPLP